MKKHLGFLKGAICGLLIGVILATAVIKFYPLSHGKEVEQRKDHDVTLENNKLSFIAADFSKPILGKTTKESKLIVLDQEVSTIGTVKDIKFEDINVIKNIDIFNKTQEIEYHGTGEYTVDLSQLTADNVVLDDKTKTVTLKINHPTLNNVIVNRDETKVLDIERNSMLAIGDIKFDAKAQQDLEKDAISKMTKVLDTDKIKAQADDYAKKTVWELLQPTITSVSPEYKLDIQFL
jgi:hypothetical protein